MKAKKLISIVLVMMFLLTGILPTQTASATASNTVNPPSAEELSADDWTQIKTLLPASADSVPYIKQAYLKASNTDDGDRFGSAISLSGDTLVIGTADEDSNATGVNGNQADNSASSSGAAYVFVRDSGGVWSQQAYLKASNTESADFFGSAVSLSGNTLVIGAYGEDSNATGVNGDEANNSALGSGAAYIFIRDSEGVWSQQAYLKASNTDSGDFFGIDVSLSGDTLVIGAQSEDSNATGVNGNQADNSASSSGAAYVFARDSGGVWSQTAYLKASNTGAGDRFGCAVSISRNSQLTFGYTLVVGAELEDSNTTGANGNQGNNSATNSGAAYVFISGAGGWSQQAYLKASNTGADDFFGDDVSLYINLLGDTIVIGAQGEDSNATGVNGNQGNNLASFSGAAYVFTRSGGVWTQQAYLKASNTESEDFFGSSVSLSNGTLVVGAQREDSNATDVNGNDANNSASSSGAAYVFTHSGSRWSQQAYLKASNTGSADFFGSAVSLSGNTIVIGAFGEDSDSGGVNGNESDSSAPVSGAAYVYIAIDALTLQSVGTQDGRILESSETSNQGGTLNNSATVLVIGDNAQDKQYRSFLSFDTSGLPDDAVITKAQLKIKVQGFVGNNMFTPVKTHGSLLMDIRAPFFGMNADLAITDFQAAASKNSVGVLASAPATGTYTVTLKATSFPFVNLTGTTQFRLRFQTDDNDDLEADYLKIYSGDAGAADRPQLIVEYYVP